MEDSGIESDSKVLQKSEVADEVRIMDVKANGAATEKSSYGFSSLRTSSDLQKKIERQREAARKTEQQSRRGLLTRNRLPVPSRKEDLLLPSDTQPLVLIDSDDDSEDEFAMPRLSKQAHKEITQQLIKDGYNLDMEPDDEDLDLIPPRPVHERCICCNMQVNCCIQ